MWIILDILIIAVLFLAAILVTPRLSGWDKLASVYRAQRAPSGERFLFEFAKVGDIYLWHGIILYRSPDGIYLSAGPVVGLRQPPVFIPWSELRNPHEKRLFFIPVHEFQVGSPPVSTLQLRSEIVKNHVQSSNPSLQPTAGRRDAHI